MSDIVFRRIILSVVILAGVLLYCSTINHPQFLFDGTLFLQQNPLFKDLDYYTKLFDISEFSTLDEQLGLDSDVTTNFMMRPVAYLTFSANYLLSGFNPAAFRSVNIVIHILNSLLVFICIDHLLKYNLAHRPLSQFSLRFIPAVTVFVFLLHPLQTESVTYITQRFASLAALFYLTTIWLYLVWVEKHKQGKCGYVRWLSVAALLLGMLTRESLFTAPIMIVLLEVTVLGNNLKAALKRATPHLLLLPLIPLLVIMVSIGQNNSQPSISGALNVVNYGATPVAHYALTQVVVVMTYVRLLLLPYGQNVDHDPLLYTHLLQLPVIVAGLLIVFMLAGSLFLFRKYRGDVRCVLILVGVCWYFLALAVSSSIVPLPDLMAEHRSYFASIGFVMALVCLLDVLRSRFSSVWSNRIAVLGVTAWCLVLVVLTYNRNNLWQSGVHLWSDAAIKSPSKHRPWYNLGVAYVKSGRYSEAISCLRKSIEISPEWGQAYEILAISYLELKRFQDAMEISLRGIDVDPSNPVYYNHLGVAYAELDRPEDAKQAFSTALALLPGYKNALTNLDKIESFMESNIGKRK